MHAFDRDMEFVRESDGVLVTMSDRWSINHIPNGGYTMALLTRAMMGGGGDQTLVSCITTANYMERCVYSDKDSAWFVHEKRQSPWQGAAAFFSRQNNHYIKEGCSSKLPHRPQWHIQRHYEYKTISCQGKSLANLTFFELLCLYPRPGKKSVNSS